MTKFDHPLLTGWCPQHGYYGWASCPGCVWETHGDKYGMTWLTVRMQEVARVLEQQRDEARSQR